MKSILLKGIWLVIAASLLLTSCGNEVSLTQSETASSSAADSRDSAKEIEDGTYAPDSFRFSGGSGKLTINCEEIIIENGKTSARISFDSTYIEYVKSCGSKITDYQRDDSSTSFVIPIILNEENTIQALTTKMSEPHEIAYTLYIGLNDGGAGDENEGVSEPADTNESKGFSDREAGLSDDPDEQQLPGTQKEILFDEPPAIDGQSCTAVMQPEYADGFRIYYYQDDYKLIDIPNSGKYLIVPENGTKPEGLDENITVIFQPLDEVYLAATNAMSFFDRLGAIDVIKMSSLEADSWSLETASAAMKSGKMEFAGKYSEPDYEMMVAHDCDLALESTMILHTPEVQEMIEDLDIPVLIDRSSYESEVLGRIEWVKLYGALTNREAAAEEIFKEQKEIVDSLEDFENTGKTVAFFSVNSDRSVVVRKIQDIIPNMIEIAGAKYVPDNAEDPSTNSASMNMSMEEFYSKAVDADYIIYNGTIVGALSSVDDLLGKDPLFAEFKAVKEGNVWTVDKSWYQDTANVANLITDMNIMLTDGDQSKLRYMKKISK